MFAICTIGLVLSSLRSQFNPPNASVLLDVPQQGGRTHLLILEHQRAGKRATATSDITTAFLEPRPTLPQRSAQLFDCSQQANNITIVREIGRGKKKVTYEVILSNGVHAAAKRLLDPRRGVHTLYSLEEGQLFQKLNEQYGEQAVQYYGYCLFPYPTFQVLKMLNMETILRDFTRGYTLFLELGEPLMTTWVNHSAYKNVDPPRPKTDDDLDSMPVIARQYDNFVGGRLKLLGDTVYGHQYARVAAGIRNVDLDNVRTVPPPSKSVLPQNCHTLLVKFAWLHQTDPRVNNLIPW
jgi:hypothetical protein